jgi:putative ABC transport system ATP-binding protein
MATLREPGILLLDEHTAALDPRSAEQVMVLTNTIIARYRLTALMVTHDMAEAVGYGSRLIMMHNGAIDVDYAGDDKKRLTSGMLLDRFAQLRTVPAVG